MEAGVFEILMLTLRVALVLLLYFFVFMVIRVISREFDFASRRARSVSQSSQAVAAYPEEEEYAPPQGGAMSQPRGRLVVTEVGNNTTLQVGAVLSLRPVTPLGRRPDNAIVLNDDYVSNEHALIAFRDGYWWLSDVASTNGTTLNNQPIQRPTALRWGDLIGVGRVRMRLEP